MSSIRRHCAYSHSRIPTAHSLFLNPQHNVHTPQTSLLIHFLCGMLKNNLFLHLWRWNSRVNSSFWTPFCILHFLHPIPSSAIYGKSARKEDSAERRRNSKVRENNQKKRGPHNKRKIRIHTHHIHPLILNSIFCIPTFLLNTVMLISIPILTISISVCPLHWNSMCHCWKPHISRSPFHTLLHSA